MFALLARAGTMARFPRAPLAESSTEEGPYAGWEVCLSGCHVWFNHKLPSPGFRVLSAREARQAEEAPPEPAREPRRRAKPSRPYLFVASQQAGNLGRNLISPPDERFG
jgi:hypothetical protein